MLYDLFSSGFPAIIKLGLTNNKDSNSAPAKSSNDKTMNTKNVNQEKDTYKGKLHK